MGIWIALVALLGIVILAAAPLPHVDSDAPLYSLIAANVLKTGDWLTFYYPGWLVDKPPVTFWVMAATFRLLGITDASMRLWQLTAALLLLGLTGAVSRSVGLSAEASVLAMLILGTAVQFFYQTTVPQQDILLTLFLTLGIWSLLRYLRRPRLAWVVVSALAVALAVLTKGIAGLVLFLAIAVPSLFLLRRDLAPLAPRLGRDLAVGALVFVTAAAPWFVRGVIVLGDAFVDTFLLGGTLGVGRFFRPAISTPPPYWLSIFAYVPMLLLGMLPWMSLLVLGLLDIPRLLREGSPGTKLLAVWLLGIFVVVSVSSGDKVFRYLLPCFPPAAILAARAGVGLVGGSRRLRWAGWIALVPAVLLLGAAFWYVWMRFPPERGLLTAIVGPCFLALVVGLIGFAMASLWGRIRVAVVLAAVGAMIGYALFERNMMVHAAAVNPWPALAQSAPGGSESNRLVLYGRAGELANFAHFYFNNPVIAVNTVGELRAFWRRERLMVVVPAARLGELAVLQPRGAVLHRSPAGLILIANWTDPTQ